MLACIPITPDGLVAPGWGRAHTLALADVTGRELVSWREVQVGWDVLHDEGTEGAHHARVVRFLRENAIEIVVASHMGSGMSRTLGTMGIPVVLAAHGGAQDAVLAAVAQQ